MCDSKEPLTVWRALCQIVGHVVLIAVICTATVAAVFEALRFVLGWDFNCAR